MSFVSRSWLCLVQHPTRTSFIPARDRPEKWDAPAGWVDNAFEPTSASTCCEWPSGLYCRPFHRLKHPFPSRCSFSMRHPLTSFAQRIRLHVPAVPLQAMFLRLYRTSVAYRCHSILHNCQRGCDSAWQSPCTFLSTF